MVLGMSARTGLLGLGGKFQMDKVVGLVVRASSKGLVLFCLIFQASGRVLLRFVLVFLLRCPFCEF